MRKAKTYLIQVGSKVTKVQHDETIEIIANHFGVGYDTVQKNLLRFVDQRVTTTSIGTILKLEPIPLPKFKEYVKDRKYKLVISRGNDTETLSGVSEDEIIKLVSKMTDISTKTLRDNLYSFLDVRKTAKEFTYYFKQLVR